MVLFLAATVIFIYGMLASMLGTVVPGLAVRLGLSNVQIGYLALAQGLGLAATSVVAGAIMDRGTKKIGMVFGLCASILGLILLSSSNQLWPCIVAMAVLGCGGSLVIVGSNALAAEVRDERKGTALNVLNVFVGLGGLATPFVAGNLLGADVKKITFCGIGICVLALVLTFLTRISPKNAAPGPARDASVFRDPTLYVLSLITFFYTACEFAMWNWLPKYLIANGMPSVTALNILSLGFACGILVGRLIAARVLVNVAPLPTTLVSALFMAITSLVMLNITTVFGVAAIVFLTGLSMAPVFPTTIAIVSARFKRRAATAIGFAITCGFSGLVVSSPVIGWIAGTDPHGVKRGLLLIPILSIAIVVVLSLVRPALSRLVPEPA